jgi:formylglycine-generating enzyme required for sulfatase activity
LRDPLIINPPREGRVLRGGAWDQDDFSVRVSYRLNAAPSDVYYTFGFRCASDSAP